MHFTFILMVICLTLPLVSSEATQSNLRGFNEVENLNPSFIGDLQRRLFNVFKSYGDTPMKDQPPQYSRKGQRRHPEDEYLSKNQLRMKANRYEGSVSPEDSFDANWSGFKEYKTLKQNRKEGAKNTKNIAKKQKEIIKKQKAASAE